MQIVSQEMSATTGSQVGSPAPFFFFNPPLQLERKLFWLDLDKHRCYHNAPRLCMLTPAASPLLCVTALLMYAIFSAGVIRHINFFPEHIKLVQTIARSHGFHPAPQHTSQVVYFMAPELYLGQLLGCIWEDDASLQSKSILSTLQGIALNVKSEQNKILPPGRSLPIQDCWVLLMQQYPQDGNSLVARSPFHIQFFIAPLTDSKWHSSEF